MHHRPLLRLLELACRDLGATDARAEIGGRDPTDPCLVWCHSQNGLRIVLVFEKPPADGATRRDKLRSLVDSFASATEDVRPSLHPAGPGALRRRLDDTLELLRERAGATAVVVIDTSSPEVWGMSEVHRVRLDVGTASDMTRLSEYLSAEGLDASRLLAEGSDALDSALKRIGAVDLLLLARRLRVHGEPFGAPLGLEQWRRHVVMSRAIDRVRRADEAGTSLAGWQRLPGGVTAFVRAFAGIYRLVAVFDENYSELKAEGAVARVLPHVERLVTSLPPTEPPDGGMKSRQVPP